MFADVQYPTPWLPMGLVAASVAVTLLIRAWPLRLRIVLAVALVAVILIGYALLPQVLDIDRLFTE